MEFNEKTNTCILLLRVFTLKYLCEQTIHKNQLTKINLLTIFVSGMATNVDSRVKIKI